MVKRKKAKSIVNQYEKAQDEVERAERKLEEAEDDYNPYEENLTAMTLYEQKLDADIEQLNQQLEETKKTKRELLERRAETLKASAPSKSQLMMAETRLREKQRTLAPLAAKIDEARLVLDPPKPAEDPEHIYDGAAPEDPDSAAATAALATPTPKRPQKDRKPFSSLDTSGMKRRRERPPGIAPYPLRKARRKR